MGRDGSNGVTITLHRRTHGIPKEEVEWSLPKASPAVFSGIIQRRSIIPMLGILLLRRFMEDAGSGSCGSMAHRLQSRHFPKKDNTGHAILRMKTVVWKEKGRSCSLVCIPTANSLSRVQRSCTQVGTFMHLMLETMFIAVTNSFIHPFELLVDYRSAVQLPVSASSSSSFSAADYAAFTRFLIPEKTCPSFYW